MGDHMSRCIKQTILYLLQILYVFIIIQIMEMVASWMVRSCTMHRTVTTIAVLETHPRFPLWRLGLPVIWESIQQIIGFEHRWEVVDLDDVGKLVVVNP